MALSKRVKEEIMALKKAVDLMMKELPEDEARLTYQEIGKVFEECIERGFWKDARTVGIRVLTFGFFKAKERLGKAEVRGSGGAD